MGFDELSKEQQIMVSMRKVLSNIIKEITPNSRDKYPLSEQTVQDVRLCLMLITTREQELAKAEGMSTSARPHYTDEPQNTHKVNIHRPTR